MNMTIDEKIYKYAKYSNDAYLNPDKFEILKAEFITNDCTGAQLYTWINTEDERVIVFRGSSEIKDFLKNIDLRTTILCQKEKFCFVHKGFYDQFISIESELTEIIKNNEKILFVGHSLGGGLSQIASLYYKLEFPDKIIKCITFGSPRVGNSRFADLFDSKINEYIRILNEHDPVPLIPISWRFKHVKRGMLITDEFEIKEIVDDIKWYQRLCKETPKVDVFNPIGNHRCNVYIYRLQKYLNIEDDNNNVQNL